MTDLLDARRRQAAEAAALLYDAGAHRVWVFGSTARLDVRDARSDLDLAVEGMTEAQIKSMREALRTRFRCKVDVVSMERALPELRQGILKCRVLMRPGEPLPVGNATLPSTRRSTAPIRSLNDLRYESVLGILHDHAPRRVLDLGCGPGRLIQRIAELPSVDRITGVDASSTVLGVARRRLAPLMHADQRPAVKLILALATNPDPRFLGHDAVVAIEMIEHLDPARLNAFGRILFDYLRPPLIVITTPNREYNARWGNEGVRDRDHKFEWTRAQFQSWIADADRNSVYRHAFDDIGTPIAGAGGPTQRVVCARRVSL
ncbi:methyltransferase domain-containing protein [Paraburkholderia dilworthii]|uniref:methyltransferase domain-containing protein n=1 Tax=Paraburkholderia dilworthii TaxID=948106 RepID=UPI0003FB896E|nr:methyltransferase domain-containing protein [Paraburkholderia dilworthii]